MSSTSKNIAIGVLVTVAFSLIVWVLLFLHPTFGDGGKTLRVRFPNIDKISVGTRVTFAGRPIGEVLEITEVPEAREQEANDQSQIYTYELALSLDSSVDVYESDDVGIRTSGLMGEKFIAITPKRAQNGNPRKLNSNELIYASTQGSVEDTFSGINTITKKAEKTIDELTGLIEKNREEFQSSLKAIQGTTIELEKFLKRANEQDLAGNMNAATVDAQNTMKKIEELLQTAQDGKLIQILATAALQLKDITTTLTSEGRLQEIVQNAHTITQNLSQTTAILAQSSPKIEKAIDKFTETADQVQLIAKNANDTTGSLKSLVDNLTKGSGTLGKLIADEDFYFKTLSVLNKADTLMADVNHYGILFHLDKGWQRDRRKRMAELARLQTPQEFRGYLDDEMQKISTSVSRVNMALDKVDNALSDNPHHPQQKQFREDFARTFDDLMLQVQGLERTLKNYSENYAGDE